MPERIDFNDDEKYIQVTSFGEVSERDIRRTIEAIHGHHASTGVNRILVDTLQQETMPSLAGIFELFAGFPPVYRVAILVDPAGETARENQFLETVTINRGRTFQIFTDRKVAKVWLQKG